MSLFTDGIWYSGVTPQGALHMFKSTKEEFLKIASGGVGVAHHLLKLVPGQNPFYLPGLMNTTDPVLLNGRHFMVVSPATGESAQELDNLMDKHFNPPQIEEVKTPIEIASSTTPLPKAK